MSLWVAEATYRDYQITNLARHSNVLLPIPCMECGADSISDPFDSMESPTAASIQSHAKTTTWLHY